MDTKSLSSMVEQQVKRIINRKIKEANVHMVNNALESPRGVAPTFATLAAKPYQQQNQSA